MSKLTYRNLRLTNGMIHIASSSYATYKANQMIVHLDLKADDVNIQLIESWMNSLIE